MKRAAYVMVNHNGGEEILLSLRSLLEDLGPDDAVVLVDNGSTDGSGERASAESSRIVYLDHRENLPFATATNRGVGRALEAGYAYVGPINPDVRISSGMTDALIRRLEDHNYSGRAAVSPVMLYDDPADTIWYAGGRIWWLLGWMSHRGQGRKSSSAHCFGGTTGYLTGCCWLATAEVWNRVGMLDDSYGIYAEDADWSYRAAKAGVELLVEPLAILVHRLSRSSGGGRSPFKMTYRTLASRLFFRRYTSPYLRPFQDIFSECVVAAYAAMLFLKGERQAAIAYLKARRTSLGDRVPWPPSR